MKIYFTGSIRGGRGDKEIYHKIINHLKKYGSVLTEHVGSDHLTEKGEDGDNQAIHARDMFWIKECDVVIAEVTTPSLGVGYEIATAENLGKKILCLFRKEDKKLSALIAGNRNLNVKNYVTLEEAFRHIDEFLTTLSENM